MVTKLLLTGFFATTLMFAQRGGGGGMDAEEGVGGGRGGRGNMGAQLMAVPSRMDILTQALKLTKDQRKLVKTTMDDGQKEAGPVREQLAKGRKAIAQAVAGGNQEQVTSAVNAYATAEAEMTTIELKAFAKIYPALEKDQRQRGGQLYGMMAGIFKGKNWNE